MSDPRNTIMFTYEDAGARDDPPGVYGYYNIWFGWDDNDWEPVAQVHGPKTPEVQSALERMCTAFNEAVAICHGPATP